MRGRAPASATTDSVVEFGPAPGLSSVAARNSEHDPKGDDDGHEIFQFETSSLLQSSRREVVQWKRARSRNF